MVKKVGLVIGSVLAAVVLMVAVLGVVVLGLLVLDWLSCLAGWSCAGVGEDVLIAGWIG